MVQGGDEVVKPAQVVDVTKMLAGVIQTVRPGNKLVFDSEGSYILNKTNGQTNPLREENDSYVLDMWVLHALGKEHVVDKINTQGHASGSTRQAALVTVVNGA